MGARLAAAVGRVERVTAVRGGVVDAVGPVSQRGRAAALRRGRQLRAYVGRRRPAILHLCEMHNPLLLLCSSYSRHVFILQLK